MVGPVRPGQSPEAYALELARNRRYYHRNRAKVLSQARTYRRENRDKINKRDAEYRRTRLDKMRQADNHRKFVATRKAFIAACKDQPCADCGVRYPPYVMDFDHVRGVKRKDVGLMRLDSLENLMNEIEKCDVVCANCHRERTHTRLARSLLPHQAHPAPAPHRAGVHLPLLRWSAARGRVI